MKICFPVDGGNAEKSKVLDSCVAAPFFVVYDDSTKGFITVENKHINSDHDGYDPMASFVENKIDAVVVGGISKGALKKFNEAKIKVYKGVIGSVEENIVQFNQVGLHQFTL